MTENEPSVDENMGVISDDSPQSFQSITSSKLAELLKDHAAEASSEDGSNEQFFFVIDCRYPYEYKGGHIQGAINLYKEEDINSLLENPVHKYKILIFHCEFSSKRGPKIMKYLRKKDREKNKHRYPHLYFPDVYLLRGGYKGFYQRHKEWCSPSAYIPMRHEDYAKEYLHFRSSTKLKHRFIKKEETETTRNCRKCLRF